MELVNDKIEYEQLLGENSIDTIVQQDYLIPDTHPDVEKILMVKSTPIILSKKIMNGKIYIEGESEYTVIYLAKTEKGNEVFSVTYNDKFSNSIEINGANKDMLCTAECYVEHMEANISNERKVSIKGIIQLKVSVYKNYNYSIVKDIKQNKDEDIEVLKNPVVVDKIAASLNCDLVGKGHLQIDKQDLEIDNIVCYDVNICKEEVVLYDGKVKLSCVAHVKIVYKCKDSCDINCIECDIPLTKEIEDENVDEGMENYCDFVVDGKQVDTEEDDLGENRIINIEILVKCNIKVMSKEEINMIEDAYSPSCILNIKKDNYMLNVIHGCGRGQALAKGEISIDNDMPSPYKIIYCNGNTNITDKKIVEDKVLIEGVVNTEILYSSKDKEQYLYCVKDGIPFNCDIEILGSKIDMSCMAKLQLETIEANIEPGQIAVKAIINTYAMVNYLSNKDFITNVEINENEVPEKKASITIYIVQSGDTLWKIAKNYNTNINDLISINNIEDPNAIKVGSKLIIPGRAII